MRERSVCAAVGVLLLAAWCVCALPQCSESQRLALLTTFGGTQINSSWINNYGWTDVVIMPTNASNVTKTTNCCAWYGINCTDAGLVMSIDLQSNGLTGSLSPTAFLGLETGLLSINLDNNRMTGTFPVSLSQMVNLQNFTIRNNQFSGQIDPQALVLPNLQLIDLFDNNFVGPIPDFSCPLLNSLSLRLNQFTGPIPSSLAIINLQLQTLDLSFNYLSGQIPDGIGSNLTNLRWVDLSGNGFSGTLPPSLGQVVTSWANYDGTVGGLGACESDQIAVWYIIGYEPPPAFSFGDGDRNGPLRLTLRTVCTRSTPQYSGAYISTLGS